LKEIIKKLKCSTKLFDYYDEGRIWRDFKENELMAIVKYFTHDQRHFSDFIETLPAFSAASYVDLGGLTTVFQ